jgi:hypothetical protein
MSIPKRAQELAALIEEYGWYLVNSLDVPIYYYKTSIGSLVLDVTLVVPAMVD